MLCVVQEDSRHGMGLKSQSGPAWKSGKGLMLITNIEKSLDLSQTASGSGQDRSGPCHPQT